MLKRGLRGQQLLAARAHTPGGTGVPPRRRSVLKEGMRGAAAPNGPNTPASWGGESCPGGGRCSRRACVGQQLPTAREHQLGGMGSSAQAVVGAQGVPGGAVAPHGPGTPV